MTRADRGAVQSLTSDRGRDRTAVTRRILFWRMNTYLKGQEVGLAFDFRGGDAAWLVVDIE
jgi:hypothetical protein